MITAWKFLHTLYRKKKKFNGKHASVTLHSQFPGELILREKQIPGQEIIFIKKLYVRHKLLELMYLSKIISVG